MRWWMVLLLIAGVLTLLLCMSVSFHIVYREKDLRIKFCYGGIRFLIYPRKDAKKAENSAVKLVKDEQKALGNEKKGRKKKKKPMQQSEPRGIKETIFLVVDLLKSTVNPGRFLLRHLRVTAVDVTVMTTSVSFQFSLNMTTSDMMT